MGSHFSWMVVSAGSNKSQTVSTEAKYDRQPLLEAKISGLVYTLCKGRLINLHMVHSLYLRVEVHPKLLVYKVVTADNSA